MGCEECDRIQEIMFDKNIPHQLPIAYVRIGNANVAIVGCNKHIKQLIDELRKDVKGI